MAPIFSIHRATPNFASTSGGTEPAVSSAARSRSLVARAPAPSPPPLSMIHPSSARGLGALGASDAALFRAATHPSPSLAEDPSSEPSRHIARPLNVLGLSAASFSAPSAAAASRLRPTERSASAATMRTRRSHPRAPPGAVDPRSVESNHPSAKHAFSALRACSNATAASPAMCAASAAALHPTTLAPGPRGSGAAAAAAAAASDASVVITRVEAASDADPMRALSSAASASPSATRPGRGSAAAPAADPGG
mmetsp:Transcript_3902/g.17349  ORF Transcript_3902/g.17349 Transcript_3902/m.17349 type:complete len:253 (+) Transcript_3902:802-1560(+)